MTPPPPPLPPPPRRVHMSAWARTRLWLLRLFSLPLGFVGGSLILGSFALPAVKLFGTDVTGRVIEMVQDRDSEGDQIYKVRYAYTVGGTEWQNDVQLSKEAFGTTAEGQEFPVRVLTAWPRLAPQPNLPGQGVMGVVGWLVCTSVCTALLAVVVWFAWALPRRNVWLLRHGTAVRGVIVAKVEENVGEDGVCYRLRYQYRATAPDVAGAVAPAPQTREGKVTVSARQYKESKQGGAVTVLYDPRRPERSLVYE